MRLALFIALELLALPLQTLAMGHYVWRIRRKVLPAGISGTAHEPLQGRLLLHWAGLRPDAAAARMAARLPAFNGLTAFALFGTMGLASRLSGYRGGPFVLPPPRPASMGAMINHRTAFFDRVIREALADGVTQVVILGAGWDTRAYGLLRGHDVRIYEVDLPPTQQAKRRALDEAGIYRAQVRFVPTTFDQTSWLQALIAEGFDPAQPTFVLWEGVTMYLSERAIHDTLQAFASLAPGSRFAFDYLSREFVDCQPPHDKLGRRAKAGLRLYGESWVWGISTAPEAMPHVRRLLNEHGLCLADWEPFGSEGEESWYLGGLVLAEPRVSGPTD